MGSSMTCKQQYCCGDMRNCTGPEEPTMVEEVTKLRRGAPSLNDIPAQLRQMADRIEAKEEGYVGNAGVFILLDQDREGEDWPQVFGWGEALGDYQMIGVLEIVKTWFVVNKTKRFT